MTLKLVHPVRRPDVAAQRIETVASVINGQQKSLDRAHCLLALAMVAAARHVAPAECLIGRTKEAQAARDLGLFLCRTALDIGARRLADLHIVDLSRNQIQRALHAAERRLEDDDTEAQFDGVLALFAEKLELPPA